MSPPSARSRVCWRYTDGARAGRRRSAATAGTFERNFHVGEGSGIEFLGDHAHSRSWFRTQPFGGRRASQKGAFWAFVAAMLEAFGPGRDRDRDHPRLAVRATRTVERQQLGIGSRPGHAKRLTPRKTAVCPVPDVNPQNPAARWSCQLGWGPSHGRTGRGGRPNRCSPGIRPGERATANSLRCS